MYVYIYIYIMYYMYHNEYHNVILKQHDHKKIQFCCSG